MWSIETDKGSFEGESLMDAVNAIAKWTVDDMNGEHCPTPTVTSICYFDGDVEEYEPQESIDKLNYELDDICDAAQDGFDDSSEDYRSLTSSYYR